MPLDLNRTPLTGRMTPSPVLTYVSIDWERRLLTPDLSRVRPHASSSKRASR